MKWRWAAVAGLLVLATTFAEGTVPSSPHDGLSLEDLITFCRTGIESSVIRERILTLGLSFEPGPRERERLREAGFDDALLRWLSETGPTDPAPTAVPAGRRETVRIFEEITPAGRRMLVLTNLDEAGVPIRDPFAVEEPAGVSEPADLPAAHSGISPSLPVADAAPPLETPAPPPVVVEVNVEVPPMYPGYYPYLVAGFPGGNYPSHLDFLGYGNNISKPSWFSGLGLNAANNFGHNTVAKPNNTGLDAFFGPPRP